ncbi:bifunctional DNA primase/polymerase [Streptomyces sp. M10(2022)]
MRVRTPTGGLHVWYRNTAPAIRYRSSAGSSSKVALAWQVDVRAHGGYIIAPTTRTSQGTYEAVGTTRMPAPLPDWLASELTRTGHVVTPTGRSPFLRRLPGRAAHVVRNTRRGFWIRSSLPSPSVRSQQKAPGSTKAEPSRIHSRGLVAAGHLDEPAVRKLLATAADAARPWQAARNEKTILDGLAAGSVRPLHLEGRS